MSSVRRNRSAIQPPDTEPQLEGLDRPGRTRLWQFLERATNVAILIACVALVTAVLRAGRPAPPPTPPPGPVAGDRLEGIDGLDLAAHEQTLLLVVSSHCRYCTESMPFYRRLLDRREERTQVVAASAESAAVTAAYLAAHGVEADRILEVAAGELGTSATPTLLDLSRSGEIREVIVGRVPDAEVAAVTARLLRSDRMDSAQELGTRDLALQ